MKPRPIPKDKQRCSVLDCPSGRREKSHHYPMNQEIGLKWVAAANNPRLYDLTYKQIYENRYKICYLHFKPEDYSCGLRRRLKEGAIPSLMLPLLEETDGSVIPPKVCK